ncbi:nucleotide exchange factor GrpE [Candidatus Woesearchaeota archaeon]|nr:nucleotide exchange factor GrpE [Candidatus Woesearchaeota archaeon]
MVRKEAEKKEPANNASANEELKKKADDYKDALQRLQAEFENYKKRCEKENAAFRKYANAELVKSMLPLLDSFEMALKNTADKEKFVKGVELIYAQLYSMLEDYGLKRIEANGKQFDPYKHEVLLQEESEKDGVVLEELQKGYLLDDAVIRHSKVKVGKKREVEEEKEEKSGDERAEVKNESGNKQQRQWD